MPTGLINLAVTTRDTGMKQVVAAVEGTKPWPSLPADVQSLAGTSLDTAFSAADSAAAAEPTNFGLRMQAAYAYAVARDYKYATAKAPRFHFARGAQTNLYGLYFGACLDVEAAA